MSALKSAIVVALLACSLLMASSAQAHPRSGDIDPSVWPPGIKLQRVFEGAALSYNALSTYRVITSLSPEELLSEIESLWQQRLEGRVWRDAHAGWQTVSRVVRPPVAEVVQARRDGVGRTEAWFSVGLAGKADDGGFSERLPALLPPGLKLLQRFSNRDGERIATLVIARAAGVITGVSASLEASLRRAGFKRDPRLRFRGEVSQSYVGFFSRGREEIFATLDRDEQGVALVLQYSASVSALPSNVLPGN